MVSLLPSFRKVSGFDINSLLGNGNFVDVETSFTSSGLPGESQSSSMDGPFLTEGFSSTNATNNHGHVNQRNMDYYLSCYDSSSQHDQCINRMRQYEMAVNYPHGTSLLRTGGFGPLSQPTWSLLNPVTSGEFRHPSMTISEHTNKITPRFMDFDGNYSPLSTFYSAAINHTTSVSSRAEPASSFSWPSNRVSGYFSGRCPVNPETGLYFHPFRKVKRMRTAFSPSQLLRLEHAFEKNHYLVGQERKDLATNLNLTEIQVKVWFQNRRTKHKRVQVEEEMTQSLTMRLQEDVQQKGNNL
ncbi:hypothetical protein CHS0354_003353 [Potamilus streckersoni]|uniref:Homeobox domain-containing protein n=1 Tax=Potamilus streckersoni TaxID=2493646 RepID=A0AAE0S559_9BIVA|nr:hypothetical protein CHS0354_003353 [Potamilus streckersoni]